MIIFKNSMAILLIIAALYSGAKGMYLSYKLSENGIPTKLSSLSRASYFSIALILGTIAFEIKSPTMLCVFVTPVIVFAVWLEYIINTSYGR
jgi:uncharacterized membrane protein SpoIIM required for sporulation